MHFMHSARKMQYYSVTVGSDPVQSADIKCVFTSSISHDTDAEKCFIE